MDFYTHVLFVSARTSGFMLSMPFGEAVSTMPRLFVSVIIGCALAGNAEIPDGVITLEAGREFAIGYILGYPFRFVTDTADLVGELLDAARGQTVASVVDPLNGPAASDLAAVLRLATCALALHCGALTCGCSALKLSYELMPPASIPGLEELSARALAFGAAVVGALGGAFVTFVGAFVAVDLIAALCARVCNHFSFGTVSHLAKLVALVVVGVVLFISWGEEVVGFLSRKMVTAEPL